MYLYVLRVDKYAENFRFEIENTQPIIVHNEFKTYLLSYVSQKYSSMDINARVEDYLLDIYFTQRTQNLRQYEK